MRNRVVGLEMELRALKDVLGFHWEPGELFRLPDGAIAHFLRLVPGGAMIVLEDGYRTIVPLDFLPPR